MQPLVLNAQFQTTRLADPQAEGLAILISGDHLNAFSLEMGKEFVPIATVNPENCVLPQEPPFDQAIAIDSVLIPGCWNLNALVPVISAAFGSSVMEQALIPAPFAAPQTRHVDVSTAPAAITSAPAPAMEQRSADEASTPDDPNPRLRAPSSPDAEDKPAASSLPTFGAARPQLAPTEAAVHLLVGSSLAPCSPSSAQFQQVSAPPPVVSEPTGPPAAQVANVTAAVTPTPGAFPPSLQRDQRPGFSAAVAPENLVLTSDLKLEVAGPSPKAPTAEPSLPETAHGDAPCYDTAGHPRAPGLRMTPGEARFVFAIVGAPLPPNEPLLPAGIDADAANVLFTGLFPLSPGGPWLSPASSRAHLAPASPGSPLQGPVPRLSAQIVQTLANSRSRSEISLSPEELGHVRLSIRPHDSDASRVVVMMTFERPEAMDLFRRNADQLVADIKMAGFAGAELNFAQSGSGEDRRPAAEMTHDSAPSFPNETPALLVQAPQRIGAISALDLRL